MLDLNIILIQINIKFPISIRSTCTKTNDKENRIHYFVLQSSQINECSDYHLGDHATVLITLMWLFSQGTLILHIDRLELCTMTTRSWHQGLVFSPLSCLQGVERQCWFYHHCTYNDFISRPNSRDERPWGIVVEVRLVVPTAKNPSLVSHHL